MGSLPQNATKHQAPHLNRRGACSSRMDDGILPAPCGPVGLPGQRCLPGAGSAHATGIRRPLQPPVVVCSNQDTTINQKPRTLSGAGLMLQGSFTGGLTGALTSFPAVYGSVRLTTQTNGILMLGSGCFVPNLFRILFRTGLTRSVSDYAGATLSTCHSSLRLLVAKLPFSLIQRCTSQSGGQIYHIALLIVWPKWKHLPA